MTDPGDDLPARLFQKIEDSSAAWARHAHLMHIYCRAVEASNWEAAEELRVRVTAELEASLDAYHAAFKGAEVALATRG